MALSTTVELEAPSKSPSTHDAVPMRGRWSRRIAADTVAAADMLAVIVGGILPARIYETYGGVTLAWVLVLQSAVIAAILASLCLRQWGQYDTRRMNAFPQDAGPLFAAVAVGIVGVMGLCLPQTMRNIHMWVWCGAWLSASFTIILLVRMTARALLQRFTAEGRFDERIAVFGAGSIARRVKENLSNPALGVHFVGVYDDRIGDDRVNPEGLIVAGKLDELIRAAREDRIDRIIIALPQAADRRTADVVRQLEQLPVSVHIVTHIASDLVETTRAHEVSNVGPVGLMDVKRKPFSDWGPLVKTIEDYGLGAVLFVLALPLFALIALAIRIDSPGPVLFVQRRRGINQREIDVIKFRTMTVLEDGENIRQVSAADPRVTRVGQILRRTSLDELPQLWNVLRGDMSLVGPRPHALVHDQEFSLKLDDYMIRNQVKPGITGLAQVNGWRGETDTSDKIKGRVNHDLHYIRNWSLWLDLKILALTIKAVILGKNAI